MRRLVSLSTSAALLVAHSTVLAADTSPTIERVVVAITGDTDAVLQQYENGLTHASSRHHPVLTRHR
jgi:hypothetical protein